MSSPGSVRKTDKSRNRDAYANAPTVPMMDPADPTQHLYDITGNPMSVRQSPSNSLKGMAEKARVQGASKEMARRNAIPLMVDEKAIEMARKKAMLKQAQRSGRDSTMLTGGNSGGLGG